MYIYTIYISHCVFENLQIFSANAKGFGEEEKVLCGRDIERLQEEMGWEFAGNGNLNAETYY